MNTIIYLKGNEEKALQITLERSQQRYKKESIIKALKSLAKSNLKYNTKNGTVYLGNKWISKPVYKNDIEVYDSIDEVIEWQFVNEIMNGASRLERGFKAIG